jgi:hypothetical protein
VKSGAFTWLGILYFLASTLTYGFWTHFGIGFVLYFGEIAWLHSELSGMELGAGLVKYCVEERIYITPMIPI